MVSLSLVKEPGPVSKSNQLPVGVDRFESDYWIIVEGRCTKCCRSYHSGAGLTEVEKVEMQKGQPRIEGF